MSLCMHPRCHLMREHTPDECGWPPSPERVAPAPDAQEHELKCWPEYFGAVVAGAKRFEIRENDRGFDVGHRVTLREWEPGTTRYTGRSATFRIGYLTSWGQKPGTVVFSLEPAQEPAGPPPSGAGEPLDAIEYDSAGYPHKVRHKTVYDPCAAAMFQDIRDQLAASPEPDSKEWWRQVSQGLSVEIASLRAALASAQQELDGAVADRETMRNVLASVNRLAETRLAANVTIAAERDSTQAQIAALTARAEQAVKILRDEYGRADV